MVHAGAKVPSQVRARAARNHCHHARRGSVAHGTHGPRTSVHGKTSMHTTPAAAPGSCHHTATGVAAATASKLRSTSARTCAARHAACARRAVVRGWQAQSGAAPQRPHMHACCHAGRQLSACRHRHRGHRHRAVCCWRHPYVATCQQEPKPCPALQSAERWEAGQVRDAQCGGRPPLRAPRGHARALARVLGMMGRGEMQRVDERQHCTAHARSLAAAGGRMRGARTTVLWLLRERAASGPARACTSACSSSSSLSPDQPAYRRTFPSPAPPAQA